MNNNEKYLPVGTVVRLNNGKKNVMIIGFCPIANGGQALYDYSGCLYPEGMISSDMNLLFNHEQIVEVLFKGYVNNEEIGFKQKLNEVMAQKQAAGQLPPKGTVGNNTAPQNVQTNVVPQSVVQPQMFTNNNNQ